MSVGSVPRNPVPVPSAWSMGRVLPAVLGPLVVVLLVARLPHLTGTTWTAVRALLASVPVRDLALLGSLWALSVWCHSWVLTGALPGLTRSRAIMLNLAGSAVGDVVPFGGAAGAGMNLSMISSWHFPRSRSMTFLAVSNLWNVASKLLLPVLVLAVVCVRGTSSVPGLKIASVVAGGVLGSVVVGVVVVLAAGRGGAAEWLRGDAMAVITRGWRQLTLGMLGQLAVQAVLWSLCLQLVGVAAPLGVSMVGFALERALTMVPLTPAGAGLAEAGSLSALVALGADPASASAAVLLFRTFAYLLEIPAGGVSILAWLWSRDRAAMGTTA
ncbi:lysylphosphatidylglycerol synthase domain-containing protein [Spongisporangium articulatum]|uniref:Lysylphosphatidylglycerol synthase domain-containing protein n=1 Tax=Spongisporangium articulatum TaxID=3362603 RepID=A0ABW8ARZ8_9ACTN